MTCPHDPRPTLPGLCRHGSAALGVLPGAPPPPAPSPGSKGSFPKPPPIAADRPQFWPLGHRSALPDTTHACKSRGGPPMGWPPCRQPNSPIFSYKLVSLWLRVKLLPQPHPQMSPLLSWAPPSFLPKDPFVPHPQRPALGGSSLLPSPCLQHPVLCLPAVTMEGIWYETNKKTKLDICNICLSIYRSSSAIGGLVREASEGRDIGGRGGRAAPCHRPLSWWLAMLLSFPYYFLIFLFLFFNSNFLCL